ncbi:MAG: hypothetical protein K6E21_03865 [Bacilli bacterium]|nr:hypothetical protein [Bacilli bacterium]
MKFKWSINVISFMLGSILFVSCVPKREYIQLQAENEALKKEIEILKQTDDFFYKDAVDKFEQKEYEAALNELDELLLKYPQTSLKEDVNALISKINSEIKIIYENEKNNKNEILKEAQKADSIKNSISILKKYIAEKHPAEFIDEVKSQLQKYEETYEKEKAAIALEEQYGFKIIDYATGWRAEYLLCPEIDLKLQCLSSIPKYTTIKAVFKDTGKNEIFGEGTEYLTDNSTKAKGDVFTIFIKSGIGYTSFVRNYPSLTVDIYIEDKLYKSFNIKKSLISGF